MVYIVYKTKYCSRTPNIKIIIPLTGFSRNKIFQILLPSSSLDWLVRLNIQYPMMFKITNVNPESQRVTHCGVLEFLAEEGRCYLPSWVR